MDKKYSRKLEEEMAQEVKKGSNNERDYEGKVESTACVYTCEREAQRGDEGKSLQKQSLFSWNRVAATTAGYQVSVCISSFNKK